MTPGRPLADDATRIRLELDSCALPDGAALLDGWGRTPLRRPPFYQTPQTVSRWYRRR